MKKCLEKAKASALKAHKRDLLTSNYQVSLSRFSEAPASGRVLEEHRPGMLTVHSSFIAINVALREDLISYCSGNELANQLQTNTK